MITVSQTDVMNMARLDLLARLRATQDRINWFERKYSVLFEQFEQQIQTGAEDFAQWDDYMEWQAYLNMFADIQQDLTELRHGHFEITR